MAENENHSDHNNISKEENVERIRKNEWRKRENESDRSKYLEKPIIQCIIAMQGMRIKIK